jgi:[protein-PII] uridylyltransferase
VSRSERSADRLAALRERIAACDEALARRFWTGDDIDTLIGDRVRFFDGLIVELWHDMDWPENADAGVALFAVGGYGRGELHPFSDIDLLVVTDTPDDLRAGIEAFVQCLWDLKLDVGHSVRTVDDCRTEAERDISTATAMLERRLLCGPLALDRKIGALFATDEVWPSAKFYLAKVDEQKRRHGQFEDVEYDLEPNLKGAPGGLRDIQTIGWIIRRHFGSATVTDLALRGFLTDEEAHVLQEGRRFLWRIRYGLHLLAGRKDDRLVFDHQRVLAERFGYRDSPAQLAVEQFMHDYYRHVLALREVNDVLLQHFDEAILRAHYAPDIVPINARFQLRDGYIETCGADVFTRHPPALMEMFVIMANRRDVVGVRASTIRSVRDALDLIDDAFRHDPVVTSLFVELLRAPYTLVSQLTRMRRYGVLGRYIPEFGRVIGQMQHDLFHAYTVDAHTMMVIRNMRRLHYRSSEEKFPLACECVRNLPKIELLYIAGLFHDIGKGRGGDHSELGAVDVVAFCRRHRLEEADAALVEWLVRAHLLMSATAQRKDINDPAVIHEFASRVGTRERLDYLYALTVADINATNPTLWNSWRATLLRQLYTGTRAALERGLDVTVERDDVIRETMDATFARLDALGIGRERALALWDQPDPELFLQHSAEEIAALTVAIDAHDLRSGPLVLVRNVPGEGTEEGATEVFLFTRDQPRLFASSVIALDQLGLSIHDARIYTSASGRCFNSYIVLDESGRSIDDPHRLVWIESSLRRLLADPDRYPELARRRIPRRLKQFRWPTQARVINEPNAPYSTLHVIATDRPGLLARLGVLFVELGIDVHSAKIATLGERVEDVFYITDAERRPIVDPARIDALTTAIRDRLDRDVVQETQSA